MVCYNDLKLCKNENVPIKKPHLLSDKMNFQ